MMQFWSVESILSTVNLIHNCYEDVMLAGTQEVQHIKETNKLKELQ